MFDLMRDLDKKGFVLYYYQAYSTPSCYIKLDHGVAGSVRISDHKGIEKYQYKFNLMLCCDKSYEKDGRKYYCMADYDKMIKDIQDFKQERLDKYGFKYYDYMLDNKHKVGNEKGFFEKAKSFNDIF